MLEESADLCRRDGRDERADEKFEVNSTPTFFINGKMQRGVPKVDELDKILEPLLGS